MHLAWHIAVLPRQKKIPDLKKMLTASGAPRRIQSPEEQWAIMSAMAQASKVIRKH